MRERERERDGGGERQGGGEGGREGRREELETLNTYQSVLGSVQTHEVEVGIWVRTELAEAGLAPEAVTVLGIEAVTAALGTAVAVAGESVLPVENVVALPGRLVIREAAFVSGPLAVAGLFVAVLAVVVEAVQSAAGAVAAAAEVLSSEDFLGSSPVVQSQRDSTN